MTCDHLELNDFEDDYLIDFNPLEDVRIAGYSERRRRSLLRKSLGWDSAYFNDAGLLNPEELVLINKGFIKSDSTTQKDATRSTNISGSFKKMNNNAAVERADHVKVSNKTRNAQDFRRSQSSGLPKSTSFASPTVVKVHRPCESSSKHLYNCIKSKVSPKKVKLVNSGEPKRKIRSSGLHTPLAKIGFFDKELGSMQDRFSNENKFKSSNLSPCVSTEKCLKVGKNLSREHDGRKLSSKLKPDGQKPKENIKNRKMSLDHKRQKDEKENVLSFEDEVKQLEVVDLERDVVEVKGQEFHISFGDDNLQFLDLSEEDDFLIPFPYRDSLEDLRLSVTFDNVIDNFQSEPRRQSFLRKSLGWDSAFSTSPGLLNPEELRMINTGLKKAPSTQKDVKRSKLATNNNAAAVGGSDNVTMENKTRIAQGSKRSQLDGLPKSTTFTTERFHSSKNLSKSINPKLVNSPSSVLHFPLSSSSTSPASSIDGWLSDSSSTPVTHQKTIPVTPNSTETKFNSQNATIKSSGLRTPSPRIGFFDMEPGSIQDRFRKTGPSQPIKSQFQSSSLSPCISTLKVGKNMTRELDERKGGSKLKSKEILKMNFDQREKVVKVNDLSR